MKKLILTVIGVAAILCAANGWAAIYIWQNDQGAYQVSNTITQVPKEFSDLLGENPPDRKEQGSLGYFRDDRGNYHFFRVSPEGKEPAKIEQIAKTIYDPEKDSSWRGKPNPEVLTGRVALILTPEIIVLSTGEKLRYTGIGFPANLDKTSGAYKAAMTYQKNLLMGKTVKILFDTKKKDKDGIYLGEVFLGTDVFVNGDLVLKGYAQVKTEPPNLEYLRLYRKLENAARKDSLGIWKELPSQ